MQIIQQVHKSYKNQKHVKKVEWAMFYFQHVYNIHTWHFSNLWSETLCLIHATIYRPMVTLAFLLLLYLKGISLSTIIILKTKSNVIHSSVIYVYVKFLIHYKRYQFKWGVKRFILQELFLSTTSEFWKSVTLSQVHKCTICIISVEFH